MTAFFRVIIIIALLLLIALVVHTYVQDPGVAVFYWFGKKVTIDLPILIAAFNIALILAFYSGRLMEWTFEIPVRLGLWRRQQQDKNVFKLLAEGVDALAAGDVKQQEKLAHQITKSLPNHPAAPVLIAHLDPTTDRLHKLLANTETEFAGHMGLMKEAAKREDWAAVKFHATGAIKQRASSPIAQKTLFNALLHLKQFSEALEVLPKLKRHQVLGKEAPLWEASVRLHSAMAEKGENPTTALRQAQQAQKACPHFVPAALFGTSTLLGLNKPGPAERALSEFWHTCPRYDVFNKWLETVIENNSNLPAEKLWKKIDQLIEPKLNHPDDGPLAALCAGTAALKLGELDKARDFLSKAFRRSANKVVLSQLAALEKRAEDEAAAADWLQQAMDASDLKQP